MKVKDIMAIGALTVPKDQTVEAVAKLMRDQSVGMLLVGDETNLDGVVSDRDLLIRCIAEGDSPADSKVGAYMSTEITTTSPEDDPLAAASMMRMRRIHRMPVVENGRVIGVVSLTDIAQAMDAPLHDLLIGSSAVRRPAMSSLVGVISHYYNHLSVAALALQSTLHVNDVIHIVGNTTDLKQPVLSMEIDHEPFEAAYPGDAAAIKLNGRVRSGDLVYLETSGT